MCCMMDSLYAFKCKRFHNKQKTNSMAWVQERTVPTERQLIVDEVNANFGG
jgi:hypothetical protein